MLYDVLFAAAYFMALLLCFVGGIVTGQGMAMKQARGAIEAAAAFLTKLTKGDKT